MGACVLKTGDFEESDSDDEIEERYGGRVKNVPIYKFSVVNVTGSNINMGTYRGKVMLIVNTNRRSKFIE